MAAADRTPRKWRVPTDLAAWYTEQAEARGVSENLLVTRALEHYRDVLPPLPPAPGSAEILAAATDALDGIR